MMEQGGHAEELSAADNPTVKFVRYRAEVVGEIATILLAPVFGGILLLDAAFHDEILAAWTPWRGVVKLAIFWAGANGVGAPLVLLRRHDR